MKKQAFILLLMFIVAGCGGQGGPNTYKLFQNSELKFAIDGLNEKILEAFSNNDFVRFDSFLSDSFKKHNDGGSVKSVKEMQSLVKGKTVQSFNEFYAESSNPSGYINFPFASGDSSYFLMIPAYNKKIYVSILTLSDSAESNMLVFVYGNYNGSWKLNAFSVGRYAFCSNTVQQSYRKAQHLYAQGNLLDATCTMAFSRGSQKPSIFFSYKNSDEIDAFFKKLKEESDKKYPMPYILKDIKSHPAVFNIHYEHQKEGVVTTVHYKSNIDISDSVSLKSEIKEIREKLGNTYPGVEHLNKRTQYCAYNVFPNNQNRSPKRVVFVHNQP